jgi:DNA-binding Lrp family transcriptional regulator
MRISDNEMKFRLAELLKANSRESTVELARKLGTNRTRIARLLDSMTSEGWITRFTILTEQENNDLLIAKVPSIEGIDEDKLLEHFELIDSSFIVILFYKDLHILDGIRVDEIRIAKKRVAGSAISQDIKVTCDYCGKTVENSPIRVMVSGRLKYACCPNCSHDLKNGKKPMR